jgi:hypothetical protein
VSSLNCFDAVPRRCTRWIKISYSRTGNCVRWSVDDADLVAVRDPKNPSGGELVFTHSEWHAFMSGVRAGDFD